MDFIKNLFNSKNRSRTLSFLIVIVAYVVLTVLLKQGSVKSLFKSLLVPVCSYIVVALALNLVVGVSGELSLGHAGFMSVGAFTGIIISGYFAAAIPNETLRLIIAMIGGAVVAALIGFIISIPVLKLQGDYLAIVTLAFGQIIKSLINNIYLGFDDAGFKFSFINKNFELGTNGKMLISGPMGATGTSRISTFTAGFVLILITLFIIYNFMNSKHGRAVAATRDNRIAAQSVGINVVRTKTLAFVISAALAGAAGVLYALNYATLLPAKFDFNQSILILVYVVLGGLGNMTGTIISTVVLVLLPEMLRSLQNYRMLIYAVVLIIIMLVTNNPHVQDMIDRIKNRKTVDKGEASNG